LNTLLAQSSFTPIASLWLVGPLAIITLLLLAGHVHLTARICQPDSRRRIRMANGMLMMMLVPLATFALTLVAPTQQRIFVIAWMLVAGLITIILMLALMDASNTMRLHTTARRELRAMLREQLLAKDAARAQLQSTTPARSTPTNPAQSTTSTESTTSTDSHPS